MDYETPVVVRVQNKINTPNKLTVDYQRFDKTVFVHNFDRLVSSSRCCDSKKVHQCCNLKNYEKQKIQIISKKQDSTSTSIITEATISTRTEATITTTAKSEIYHGKRYLDPVIPEKYCIFFNNSLKAAAESTRLAFQNSVYSGRLMPEIEEICSDDNSSCLDIETQKRRRDTINDDLINQIIFPKIRVRISDEHGQRIKTSFDSSSMDDNSSSVDIERFSSSGELWSSLEYDISSEGGMIVSSDDWTIIHPIHHQQNNYLTSTTTTAETNEKLFSSSSSSTIKCCDKCGHHTTQTITSSNSSTNNDIGNSLSALMSES